MAAPALKPAASFRGEKHYGTLLANFQTAYQNMKDSSARFNAAVMTAPSGLSESERTSNIGAAAGVYENARDEFLLAAHSLNEFMIGNIVDRSALQNGNGLSR